MYATLRDTPLQYCAMAGVSSAYHPASATHRGRNFTQTSNKPRMGPTGRTLGHDTSLVTQKLCRCGSILNSPSLACFSQRLHAHHFLLVHRSYSDRSHPTSFHLAPSHVSYLTSPGICAFPHAHGAPPTRSRVIISCLHVYSVRGRPADINLPRLAPSQQTAYTTSLRNSSMIAIPQHI